MGLASSAREISEVIQTSSIGEETGLAQGGVKFLFCY